MKTVGIIAEYNPFHTGHEYQLSYLKEKCHADYLVIAMSGDYVQRGTPALFSKRVRTEMALHGGADLVFELPVAYATASAPNFAAGGVMLLDKLGAVDELCFGSECGDASFLMRIADIFLKEPVIYQEALQQFLKKGLSFPAARSQALLEYLSDEIRAKALLETHTRQEVEEILSSPNNILGIEYCRAILEQCCTMKPFSLRRKGSRYHEAALSIEEFPSASAIRGKIMELMKFQTISNTISNKTSDKKFNKSSNAISDAISSEQNMPPSASKLVFQELREHRFVLEQDLNSIMFYRLLLENAESLANYADMSESLARRIENNKNAFQDFSKFAKLLNTKEITQTRVQRALLHMLLQIQDCPTLVPYAKILGFRKTAGPLLKKIKENARIPILTKLADASSVLDHSGRALLEQDTFASNLYEGIVSQKSGQDFVHEFEKSPVIF